MARKLGFDTRAAKTYLDGRKEIRSLTTPILQGTNFQTRSSRELGELFKSEAETVYTRFGHPTMAAAEEKVAELEGGEAGLAFSTGMGAITSTLIATLRSGDHIVAQRDIFGQTYQFLDGVLRDYGVGVDFVTGTDPAAFEKALTKQTRVVYIETPSNPLLDVVDIAAVSAVACKVNAALIVDGTFASPYLQNPIEHGATLVLHSGTKFLGGHSDVMSGFVVGSRELIDRIRFVRRLVGNILDPHAAWLVLRGIKTLGPRVQGQADNALAMAKFLHHKDGIREVYYPYLESSPYYGVARKQMRGGGAVVSFEVDGGLDGARAFVDALELIPIATSLGGVESMIEVPYELDFSEEELGREASDMRVKPGLIRFSVGIENAADLTEDLGRGIEALRRFNHPSAA